MAGTTAAMPHMLNELVDDASDTHTRAQMRVPDAIPDP
jgi:hypothetical protein